MAFGNKHFCFILNGVILVSGILLIVFGWNARGYKNEIYSDNPDSKLFEVITNDWLSGTVYIFMGVIVAIFALMGFYAAYAQDRMILKYHSLFILTIVTVLALWIFVFSWFCVSDKKSLEEDYNSAFEKYASKDEIKTSITGFVKQNICCTAKNVAEFEKNKKDFPGSCCPVLKDGVCSTEAPADYNTTCAQKYGEHFSVPLSKIQNKYWWMGMTQLVAVLSALGLFWITKNTSDDGFGV